MLRPQLSEKNVYVGPELEAAFEFEEDGFFVTLRNTGDREMMVDWGAASFVAVDGSAVPLVVSQQRAVGADAEGARKRCREADWRGRCPTLPVGAETLVELTPLEFVRPVPDVGSRRSLRTSRLVHPSFADTCRALMRVVLPVRAVGAGVEESQTIEFTFRATGTQDRPGECFGAEPGEESPWVSADMAAGVGLALPIHPQMVVERLAFAYGGGATLHLPGRFSSLSLSVLENRFDGHMSLYRFVDHTDILIKGGLGLVLAERIDWLLLVAVGATWVELHHIDEKTLKPSATGPLEGVVLGESILTATGGLGTRLAWFPVDWLGLSLEALGTYAYWPALTRDEGPATVHFLAGAEAHY